MAQGSTDRNALVSFYNDRITEPSTNNEVYGYWLFVVGLLASVVGIALFLYSSTFSRPPASEGGSYWLLREVGVVFAGVGIPLILGGVAIRLPLRRLATRIVGLGVIVCLAAIVWFITVYPASGWPTDTGHTGVIALYTVGIVIIGLASVFVPMLSRAETETASERAARDAERRADAEAQTELERTRTERDEGQAATEAAAAEFESLRQSKARFEIYQDRGGGHRWRLRHRNGNIIATSGEAYSSRQKCQQGMHSVMRNALGAGVMRIEPDDPATVESETETEPIEIESQAAFELYEDNAGEHRWRLRHRNGNVIADSGEGYSSRTAAEEGIDSVKRNAPGAEADE